MNNHSTILLIISGLDPTGFAGFMRDLEVAHKQKIKTFGIVSALTAQNNQKLFGIKNSCSMHIEKQLQALNNNFNVVKIGMLGNASMVKLLIRYFSKDKKVIILDPVLKTSSGGKLIGKKSIDLIWEKLIPLSTLWTPNLDEAGFFLNKKIENKKQMYKAALELFEKNKTPILLKGGHLKNKIADFFYDGKNEIWFEHKKIHRNIRGTGCTLATLIACEFVKNKKLITAVVNAEKSIKSYF